jgi:hypothetical protein
MRILKALCDLATSGSASSDECWKAKGSHPVGATFKVALLLLSLATSAANAQKEKFENSGMQGVYATKSACADRKTRIRIFDHRIEGPDFKCRVFGDFVNAGSGLMAYDATCTDSHGVSTGPLVIDKNFALLGGADFGLSRPGATDQILLYECRSPR